MDALDRALVIQLIQRERLQQGLGFIYEVTENDIVAFVQQHSK